MQHGLFVWLALLRRNSPQAKTVSRVLPVLVAIPVIMVVTESAVDHLGVFPSMMMDLIAATVNIALLVAIVVWSIAQISAEHEARAEITHALDSAPIALTSENGEIQHWSRGCEDLYGWSAEHAIGRQKYDLLKTIDARTRKPLRRASDLGDTEREIIEQRRDGAIVHLVERVRRVEEPGCAPVYAHSMIDISKRVATEAALRESEANLNLALAAHEIGSFEWDVAANEVVFSPGAEQRLGLRQGEIGAHVTWAGLCRSR